MFRILFALIIIVPALEIGLFILSGRTIGVGWTVALIIATGVFGAWLAKKQGSEAIRLAQIQIRNGTMPSDVIIDGICILVGGVLLLTPGFITDITGFILLIPYFRAIVKIWMRKWIERMIRKGSIRIFVRR